DVDRIKKAVADQWQKLRGGEVAPETDYMEKLKSRKAEVGEQLDRSRAAVRFEAPPPAADRPLNEPLLEGTAPSAEPSKPKVGPAFSPGLAPDAPKPSQPDGYTNRLLRAKQKVWEEREKDKDQEKDKRNPS